MPHFAIDFETWYSTEVSLKKIPTWRYVFHPEAVPYLMAIHGDGFHWVGEPSKFKKWDVIDKAVWWSHNTHFDGLVWRRLQHDGVVPVEVNPSEWLDTADMVSFFRYSRPMDKVAPLLTTVEINKMWRAKAKGKGPREMKAEGWWDEMVKYGGNDAQACYEVAQRLGPRWPEAERQVSTLSREACWTGVRVDLDRATAYKQALGEFLWQVERDIPWEWDSGKTPLSPIAIRDACKAAGIECPASFDKSDPAAAAWEAKYANKHAWIKAVRYWRRVAFFRTKVVKLLEGVDDNGIYHYDMKYCGADTGRFSAGSDKGDANRFSMHGMPRFSMYIDLKDIAFHDGATGPCPKDGDWTEVNLRSLFVARDGKKYVNWDLAQIEPRLVHWVTGNHDLLRRVRERGISVYQAEAETSYGWQGEDLKRENPVFYVYIKTAYLGGQYQCGWKKLQYIAHKNGLELSDDEAALIIGRFREHNPRIVKLWRDLNYAARVCANHQETFELELPSGRVLDYPDVHYQKGDFGTELVAKFRKGESYWHLYGGILTNNLIQATGRDVLCDKAARLYAAGLGWPLWTVHDEGTHEVDADGAQEAAAEVKRLVSEEVPWLKGMPIATDVQVSDCYMK